MSDIAFKVEHLSKRYRIGLKDELPDTLVGAVTQAVEGPLRNWRRLRRLTDFDDGRKTKDEGRPSKDEYSSSVGSPKSRRSSAVRTDVDRDTIWALKDVSFEVERGEVVGIIGRNGAGKSTLLKILSQITVPTEGQAVINGRVGSLLEVGTGFHPELTGRENIYLNGAILGMTRAEIERKFDEIVDFSGVEKFIDTPVKRYSSGMRVRLAFSVAAHLDPEILLIDEVLAVGDAAFQKKCLRKMGKVASQGRTVLFVSHDMSAIINLCPSAMLIRSGGIAMHGQADRVVAQYLNVNRESNVFYARSEERRGGQQVRIENLALTPSPPKTGQPLALAIDLSRPRSADFPVSLELAITFLTDRDAKIYQIYSRHVGRVFSIPPGRQRVVARVDALPLVAGDYWINLWAGAGKTLYAWLPKCMLVTVLPGSLRGDTVVQNRGYPVVSRSTWHLESSAISD